jgi:hypothetical protein
MKIDTRPEGSFPMIKKLTGSEAFAIKIRVNDASNNDHNVFLISAPGCKQTANSPTDTNNFQQDDIAFQFSARNPDGSDGDQRELSSRTTSPPTPGSRPHFVPRSSRP